MANSMRRAAVSLLVSAALSALPACATEEVGPPDRVLSSWNQTDPDQGWLTIVSAYTPENIVIRKEHSLAYDAVNYEVFIDGKPLVIDTGFELRTKIQEGNASNVVGFLDSGPHQFRIAVAQGGPVVFAGDVTIPVAAATRLCLFGPRAALRSMVVSYPFALRPDSRRVVVINMLIEGNTLEVVSCDDATHCVPVAPPLAPGTHFDGIVALTGSERSNWSLSGTGAGIAFRQQATDALREPPPVPIVLDVWDPSRSLVAAPAYMNPDGNPF